MAIAEILLEKLLDDRGVAVAEAGALLLQELSAGRLSPAEFLADPGHLAGEPYRASRYLIQVLCRALRNEYESLDDLADAVLALSDRRLPTLEPGVRGRSDRTVVPEARVVDLRQPVRTAGGWTSAVTAIVTSGELAGSEIEICFDTNSNREACLLVSCLWIHASVAAYNLVPAASGETSGSTLRFDASPSTFLVIEPLRQINVTSVARSLHCTKPQLDQTRRGKGDTTIQTLKGMIVHAIFDRMLEGTTDLAAICDELIRRFAVQTASVVDDFFDEAAFRADILRHVQALQGFLNQQPELLDNPQIELKRYSATLGIQGRIDALFRHENRLDILELKTGARLRVEDHAQLFIYRLLLSDMIRKWQRTNGREVEITARLLSSVDGSFAPLSAAPAFLDVIHARNRLIATQYALAQDTPQFKLRYEGFNDQVCSACASWTRRACRETTLLFGDRPGSAVSPELAHFRKFTRLLERERWAADRDLVDLLDDSRTDFRRKSFRALLDTRILPDEEPYTFSFEENTSDLEAGDAVLVHAGSISSMPIYHGYVREVAPGMIRLRIPIKNLTAAAFEGRTWHIDRLPSDVTAEAGHTALYDFLLSPSDLKKVVLDPCSVEEPDASGQASGIPGEPCPNLGFNDSQLLAIRRAVSCRAFHLVWGPPGTGKTKVIPEIVRAVAPKGRVLLGAFTNTAVDKMLMALLAADPCARFLRIGRSADSPELARMVADPAEYFSEDLTTGHRSIQAIRAALDAAPVVAATAHRACTMPYLRRRAFEMTVVDEAGQLTEPLTLGLILRSRRFVLVGDDRQLPPVVRTRYLAQSMFERLKAECERYHSRHLTLLDTQYRMHPQIMAVSNRLFYDGRLRAGVPHADRLPPPVTGDGPVQVIPIVCDTPAGSTTERVNAAEADAVQTLVQKYLRAGLSPAAIGVISPFRAQVVLLRKLLGDTGVVVDTVERFQGGERDIIILSLVRAEGRGFVFDDRRFNVAITRARRKLVFVAHPELFRNSKYEWICTFTEIPRTVGTT